MGGSESKPTPIPEYLHGSKALHVRFKREKTKIDKEIQTARAQLSERIEEVEEQLTDIEESATSEKVQGIGRQFRDLKQSYLQDVRIVEDDKDTTFDKLIKKIEEIEDQQETNPRMDWEDLDDLTFRLTMFYSKYDDELEKLEKCIKSEMTSISSSLLQAQGMDNTISLFQKELSFLHGPQASFLSSQTEGIINAPEFVPEEPFVPKFVPEDPFEPKQRTHVPKFVPEDPFVPKQRTHVPKFVPEDPFVPKQRTYVPKYPFVPKQAHTHVPKFVPEDPFVPKQRTYVPKFVPKDPFVPKQAHTHVPKFVPEDPFVRKQERTQARTHVPEYVPEDPFVRKPYEMVTDNTSWTNTLTVDQSGRSFDFSKVSFYLDIPRGAVGQNTDIWYKVAESFVPSPLEEFESLVSYVVHLGPSHLFLRKPITITLVHSGILDIDVKIYDEDRHQWKILTVDYTHSSLLKKQCKVHTVKVPLTKLTAVAVVSRVVKSIDTFEVSPSGCVVRSSVCHDVIVRFPEGAVHKTMKGRMKVLPMPNVFPVETDERPCQLLFVDGFEGITFSKYVTIEMPHPCPARYPIGQVSLMCLKNDEWSEISSEGDSVVCLENPTTIELHVRHFSGLWPWLPVVPLSFLVLYGCISQAQQTVCFAAFKEDCQRNLSPKITVMCIANYEQDKIDEMRGRGYTRLACETVSDGMRQNSRAYLGIKGSFGTQRDLYLQFVKGEMCRKELEIQRTTSILDQRPNTEILTLSFYQEKAKTTLLCELHCHEKPCLGAERNLPRTASIEEPDSSDVYKMKSSPRGLMIIINMEEFTVNENCQVQLGYRTGSENDVQRLEHLFHGYLDFKVVIMRNLPRYVLLTELGKVSENVEHKKYECLAICIMSHGEDKFFYAADGGQIKVDQVLTMFTNTRCATFYRKPKLFFIQACRGDKGTAFTISNNSPSLRDGRGTYSLVQRQTSSDMSDILIAYSCYEGYAAFRSPEGSFFIQSLVRVLRGHADKEHIAEMLTRVNREVHDMVHQPQGRTQVPMPAFTLRKKLYFWPGITFN